MSELSRLAARAREEGRLGIDTEFMPEGRYRPLLCLVQVCVGEEIVVLDPLEEDLGDPAPLAEVLADPAIEVVLHAGRQDVAILRRAWRPTFANVFDTQIAAGFAGFCAQAGYTGLLHDVLKIRLEKSASFTRWDARPLTPEQLRYAREDVEHLLPLADELQRRLTRAGRLEWAREECLAIAEATDEREPEEVVAAAAARLRARPARSRPGARAGGLARAHRRGGGSPGRLDRCATRRWSSSPSARRSSRRRWARSAARARRHPAPRARHPRRRRARARRAADPAPTRASGSRRTPSTGRRSRSPRRSCARARRRPGSPTS